MTAALFFARASGFAKYAVKEVLSLARTSGRANTFFCRALCRAKFSGSEKCSFLAALIITPNSGPNGPTLPALRLVLNPVLPLALYALIRACSIYGSSVVSSTMQ